MNRRDTVCRILWGSPLPPIHSGVADYAAEILPALAERAEIRVLEPPDWRSPSDWPATIETVPTDEPAGLDEVVLVHLGNNPFHLWLLQRLRTERCVVVLHDTVLHHLLVESTHDQRLRMPGIQKPRADLLPTGALILESALAELDLDGFTVSDWGLREGVILESLGLASAQR